MFFMPFFENTENLSKIVQNLFIVSSSRIYINNLYQKIYQKNEKYYDLHMFSDSGNDT